MEGRQVRSSSTFLLLIVLVFGFTIESSHASFGKCYGMCVLTCTLQSFTPLTCVAKCVPQCLFHIGASTALVNNRAQQCTLNCASSKCSAIHSQDVENVENCANGCLGSCIAYSEEGLN